MQKKITNKKLTVSWTDLRILYKSCLDDPDYKPPEETHVKRNCILH